MGVAEIVFVERTRRLLIGTLCYDKLLGFKAFSQLGSVVVDFQVDHR